MKFSKVEFDEFISTLEQTVKDPRLCEWCLNNDHHHLTNTYTKLLQIRSAVNGLINEFEKSEY